MYRSQKPDFSIAGHSDNSSWPRWALSVAAVFLLFITASLSTSGVYAFRVFDVQDPVVNVYGLGRWDAAPHYVDGVERSLDGGLRYSIEGGSYQAFLDQLQWEGAPPTVGEFQAAVDLAFDKWEEVDPATGLGTDLYFVPDLGTPAVEETLDGYPWKLNRGAEIDLFARPLSGGLGRARVFGDPNSTTVTLTSGVTNYPAAVFSGYDVSMATDYVWPSLDFFRRVLTHELGHALGLLDVDKHSDTPNDAVSLFYDDNFDDTSQQTALNTLTNPFAQLIDAFDPDNSPALNLYEPCMGIDGCPSSPGFDTPGVDILMETSPQHDPPGPQADDFAGRQFLYPVIHWGDANGDGHIAASDYLIWAANYGDNPADNPPGPQANGDFNYDGLVNGLDYLAWARGYGQGQADGAAVPEPGALGLFAMAVLMFVSTRRAGR